MAYRTILLAYDGSPEGRRALLEGVEIAKHFKAKTHLLAVISGVAGTHVAQGMSNAEPMERTLFHRNTVDEGVRYIKRHGLVAEGHTVHGEPVEEIVKHAKQLAADLVVIGHREEGSLFRWWVTPTSQSLLEKLGCSLLVGRQECDDSVLGSGI